VWTKKAEETINFFITQDETNATETISASTLLADIIGLSTESSDPIVLDDDKRKKLAEKWKSLTDTANGNVDDAQAFKEALEVAGNLVGDLQQAYLDKLLDAKTLLGKEQLKTLKDFADNFSAVMKLQMFGGAECVRKHFIPMLDNLPEDKGSEQELKLGELEKLATAVEELPPKVTAAFRDKMQNLEECGSAEFETIKKGVEAVKKYYNPDRLEKDRPQPEDVAEQVGKWKLSEQNDWLEEQLGLLDPLQEALRLAANREKEQKEQMELQIERKKASLIGDLNDLGPKLIPPEVLAYLQKEVSGLSAETEDAKEFVDFLKQHAQDHEGNLTDAVRELLRKLLRGHASDKPAPQAGPLDWKNITELLKAAEAREKSEKKSLEAYMALVQKKKSNENMDLQLVCRELKDAYAALTKSQQVARKSEFEELRNECKNLDTPPAPAERAKGSPPKRAKDVRAGPRKLQREGEHPELTKNASLSEDKPGGKGKQPSTGTRTALYVGIPLAVILVIAVAYFLLKDSAPDPADEEFRENSEASGEY